MFRRKEESLFDNELDQNEESSFTIQPAAASPASATSATSTTATAAAAPASAPISAAISAASNAPSSGSSAAQSIARQPSMATSTGMATSAGASTPFRSSSATSSPFSSGASVSTPSSPSSISRPAEAKTMTTHLPTNLTATSPNAAQSALKPTNRVLTVGNDILLKGEIATCDRLVIEGKVEATLNDVHTLELAECGSFKGSANVVEAQISGLFEGDLVVSGRLVVYASGKVRGNISYGEVEIERGGELSGQIKMVAGVAAISQSIPKALRKEKEAA